MIEEIFSWNLFFYSALFFFILIFLGRLFNPAEKRPNLQDTQKKIDSVVEKVKYLIKEIQIHFHFQNRLQNPKNYQIIQKIKLRNTISPMIFG